MKPAWAVFRRMVFTRPSIFVTLLVFYVAAGFMSLFLSGRDDLQVWIGVVAICAIPTAGFFALATERMVQLCTSAADLAPPGHAKSVRHAQALLIVCFVVLPVVILSMMAGQFSVLFVLAMLVVGALGTTVVTKPYVLVALAVVFITTARTASLWSVIAHPAFHGAALLGALYLYYRWFQSPARIESAAAQRTVTLADATHETTDGETAQTLDIDELQLHRYAQDLETSLDEVKQEIAERPGARALAVGLGFDIRVPWRKLLRTGVIGALAVIGWHFIHGARPEWLGFAVITVLVRLRARGAHRLDPWRRG